MADNYLEKHREEYEKRKALWLKKKNCKICKKPTNIKSQASATHLQEQSDAPSATDK